MQNDEPAEAKRTTKDTLTYTQAAFLEKQSKHTQELLWMPTQLRKQRKETETSEEHDSSQGGLTLRGDDRWGRLEARISTVKSGGGTGGKQRKGKKWSGELRTTPAN